VAGARRQRFLLTGTYELPYGKGRRWGANSSRLLDGVFGGWNLNTVTLVATLDRIRTHNSTANCGLD
jgi:hypothetical protein